MANQFQNKPVEQEIVVASGVIPRNTMVVSNGSTATNQVLQAKTKDDKPLDAGVAMVYTSGLSSNLSQLAELAASQAPSQTGQFIPTNPHQQPQANPSPGIPGIKYVVPGQNIPLPIGAQQAMLGSVSHNQNVPFPGNIPPPFQKGSIIQLKSGELKRVEDLKTEDFVHSVNLCPEVKLETSTVMSIRKNDEVGMSLIGFSINSTKAQVTLSCAVEHPFFVYDKGWSSCVPEKAMQKFALQCSQLIVGDICIFLSPNVIPHPPMPASRPQASTTTSTSPEQVHAHPGTVVHQVHIQPENAGLAANMQAPKQAASTVAAAPSQVSSVAQPSSVAMTTASQLSAASGIPAGSTLIYDPQLGVLRPQSFINQQVIGTTIDGKTVPVPGGIPPFYQTIPASFVSSLPTQTIVQSPSVPAGQPAVGNGLLVTAVGLVPGQQGVRMAQSGMVYASQLTEMAQKQGHESNDGQVSNMSAEQKPDSQTDGGPPEAKRSKTEGQ